MVAGGPRGYVTQLTLRAQLLSPNGCKLMTQQLPSKMLKAVPGTLPYPTLPCTIPHTTLAPMSLQLKYKFHVHNINVVQS